MRYSPVLQSASIIMLGNFNPAIFSPAWFALQGLIPGIDPEKAEVQIIHGEYTEMVMGALRVTVQTDRFAIETASEPYVPILDVVLGTFGHTLTHTPIRQVGVNYQLHFPLDNPQQRVKLGRLLAPLSPWGEWGKLIEQRSSDLQTAGGVRALVLEEAAPDGRPTHDYRRVHIQPSVREDILDPYTGVFMLVNDHYVVEPDATAPIDADRAMSVLNESFDASIAKSKAIVAELQETASKLA
jgi:hypothetical protein